MRRISAVSNAIQTQDYEANHLIVYCLNCIRHGRNVAYEPGLRDLMFFKLQPAVRLLGGRPKGMERLLQKEANSLYYILDGRLIGLKAIGQPSWGRPNGARGHLIELVG